MRQEPDSESLSGLAHRMTDSRHHSAQKMKAPMVHRFKFQRLASFAFIVVANAAIAEQPSVDFAKDLQPIFSKNCTACHNAKKSEGGLNLDSFVAMMNGGDGGPAVVSHDIEASQIIERVIADDDSVMPPADNTVGAERLPDAHIAILKKWILEGAVDSKSTTGPLVWNKQANQMRPIYRVAAGTDGLTMVFGAGSHVAAIGSDFDGNGIVELVDPKLQGESRAHEDFIQSIAISNDNQLIATGGYRTVKIWERVHRSSSSLSGLSGVGKLVTFSPDGKRLAYANDRERLVIVDISSGRVVELLKAHSQPVTSIAWIDDTVLSSDESGVVLLTDGTTSTTRPVNSDGVPVVDGWQHWHSRRLCGITADGTLTTVELTETDDHSSVVSHAKALPVPANLVATSPDHSRPQLAVAMKDGKVWLWQDSLDREPQKIITGAPVRTLAISPLGDRVLTIAHDQPPKLWSTSDGKLIAELRRDIAQTLQLEFAQADVARQEGRVQRITAQLPKAQDALKKEETAKQKVTETRNKAAEAVAAVAKELETAAAAVTAAEKEVKQAEEAIAEAMRRMQAAQKQVEEKKKAITAVVAKRDNASKELAKRDQALATATDSAKRATTAIPVVQAEIDREAAQLSELSRRLEALDGASLPTGPSRATFDRDGKHVVVGSPDKAIRAFMASDGLPVAAVPAIDSLNLLQQLPTGPLSIVSSRGDCFELDLVPVWKLVQQIGSAEDSPFVHRVTALDFGPDNLTLAVGGGEPSRSGDIHLVDVVSGQVIKLLEAVHSDTVVDVAFSPSGRFLASAATDNLGRVFNLNSGQQVQSLEGHSHHVLGITWRNDEQVLATASADQTVKIWDFETGTARRTIGGFPNEVTDIEFLGTTNDVVCSVADGSARRHNTDNGQQIRIYKGASEALFGMGLSAKTNVVIAGGQAGTIWAWRLDSGEQFARYPDNP